MPKKTRAKIKTKPRVTIPKAKVYSLSWIAPEFINPERSPLWYLTITLVFIILEAVAIVAIRDWVTAVFILIAWVVELSYHNLFHPREMEYTIDDQGLHVNQLSYSPAQIKTYWFSYEPYPTVHFELKGRVQPLNLILSEDIDPELIRHALPTFINEDDSREEDGLARIIQRFKL